MKRNHLSIIGFIGAVIIVVFMVKMICNNSLGDDWQAFFTVLSSSAFSILLLLVYENQMRIERRRNQPNFRMNIEFPDSIHNEHLWIKISNVGPSFRSIDNISVSVFLMISICTNGERKIYKIPIKADLDSWICCDERKKTVVECQHINEKYPNEIDELEKKIAQCTDNTCAYHFVELSYTDFEGKKQKVCISLKNSDASGEYESIKKASSEVFGKHSIPLSEVYQRLQEVNPSLFTDINLTDINQ